MRTIIILTDYKGYFGSKQKSRYYNSGFDLPLLCDLFIERQYSVIIRTMSQLDFRLDDFKDIFILYTSSEDRELFYKQYIEDILFGIQLKGGILIPGFKYFRAHNNKVFMEILRDISIDKEIKKIKSCHFGTIEELKITKHKLKFPLVYKASAGAKSRGVGLAQNFPILIKKVKKVCQTYHRWDDFKEIVRKYKYRGYISNSSHRRKFIVQNFVKGLDHDFKVLVFNKNFYVLKRRTKKNDFRASGQGFLEYTDNLPPGILDFAERVFHSFNVPFISLDIAFNGIDFFLLEFQVLYFGTFTLEYSRFYFVKFEGAWIKIEKTSKLEPVYVEAIDSYITSNF